MSWVRRILPLPVAGVLVALLVVQVAMLTLTRTSDDGPTGLEVGVTGPAIVAQSVVDRAATLEDDPMEASVVDDADTGRELVRGGTLDGVVVIDLAEEGDVLVVSSATDPDVVAGLVDYVEAVSASYGRTVRADRVDPRHNAGAWRGLPVVLGVAWVLIGLITAVVATAIGGPVPPTSRAGRRRVALVAAVSLAGGALSALAVLPWVSATGPQTFVVGSLSIFAGAAFTLALEALVGLVGIGISATVVVGLLTPLLSLTAPELLPPVSARLLALTPPWAAREVLLHATYGGGWAPWGALAVIAAWCLIPVTTLVVARRERPEPAGSVVA
jgi:hypothetical protein